MGIQFRGLDHWFNHCSQKIKFFIIGFHSKHRGNKIKHTTKSAHLQKNQKAQIYSNWSEMGYHNPLDCAYDLSKDIVCVGDEEWTSLELVKWVICVDIRGCACQFYCQCNCWCCDCLCGPYFYPSLTTMVVVAIGFSRSRAPMMVVTPITMHHQFLVIK